MRTLYLLRHALAASPQGVEDKQRPLTPQGMADAAALGRAMREKGYRPGFIICSPARRTRQTAQAVQDILGEIRTITPDAAYYTSMGQLYETVKDAPSEAESVLLVSHNPAIHGLVRFLAAPDAPGEIEMGYRECTLGVLHCPVAAWRDLQPAANPLADLLIAGRDFTGTPQ